MAGKGITKWRGLEPGVALDLDGRYASRKIT
jgi:hypothetical protein